MKIELHQIEALANEICEEQATARQKLARLIRAFARIIHAKSPEAFSRRATEYSDEDGHWDNSYPPKQEYKERTGPLSISIVNSDRGEKATSGGFYHGIEYFTEDPGLFVTACGDFIGANLHGTGKFGQFAAHPGDCGVMCTIEWDELDLDDIPFDRLVKAENELRALAFPLVAARLAQTEVQS